MPDGRLIKRYANRKLYDTANSRYVTLEEVAGFVQAGEDVHIIDNQTKADITAVTLAQILVEAEKRGPRRPAEGSRPVPALRQLLQRRIAEPVQQIRTTVEESVSRLLKPEAARAEAPRAEVRPEGRPEEPRHPLLDDLQRRLDEALKLRSLWERAPAEARPDATAEALARLEARLADLARRLERIEAHLGLPDDP